MCRSVFKEWTVDDLRSLINNEDFRENQFIDYKRTFDFLEAVDKLQKVKGKNEFRNDVCSFANADGGNLIFGISEKNGIASSIVPILIKNIDSFELDLRNILLSIQPSTPNVEFNFITADDGYVVVVHIEKGFFKPYMIVENQTTDEESDEYMDIVFSLCTAYERQGYMEGIKVGARLMMELMED